MDEIQGLEEEYQLSKLLSEDLSLQVEIVDVGLTSEASEFFSSHAVLFHLRTPGGQSYVAEKPIRLISDVEKEDSLLQLYDGLEISPQSDLTAFRGEHVTISASVAQQSEGLEELFSAPSEDEEGLGELFSAPSEDEEGLGELFSAPSEKEEGLEEPSSPPSEDEKVYLNINADGRQMKARLVKDITSLDECSKNLSRYLADHTVANLNLLGRYVGNNKSPIRMRIQNVRETDSNNIALDLNKPYGTITVQKNIHYDVEPTTDYEKIVEHIGQGSVKQLVGSQLYLQPYRSYQTVADNKLEHISNNEPYVMKYETPEVDWLIFHSKPKPDDTTGGIVFLLSAGIWAMIVVYSSFGLLTFVVGLLFIGVLIRYWFHEAVL